MASRMAAGQPTGVWYVPHLPQHLSPLLCLLPNNADPVLAWPFAHVGKGGLSLWSHEMEGLACLS